MFNMNFLYLGILVVDLCMSSLIKAAMHDFTTEDFESIHSPEFSINNDVNVNDQGRSGLTRDMADLKYQLDRSTYYETNSRADDDDGFTINGLCHSFVNDFSESAANFTQCAIRSARPFKFCQNCVIEFVAAKNLYNSLKENEECASMLLHKDSVQIIEKTNTFIHNMWDESHCKECFSEVKEDNGTVYTLSNDTENFLRLVNDMIECFKNYSKGEITPFVTNTTNSTVCKKCEAYYHSLNKHYEDIEETHSRHVCVDVMDTMNYTRLLWSKNFGCRNQKGDMAAVLILSGFFCLLPIIFYIGNKIHGVKANSKILKQKRMKNVTSGVESTNSQ